MKRRTFIKGTIAAAAISTSIAHSALAKTDYMTHTGTTIIHSVYFWLKKELTATEHRDFLEFFKILKGLPGIKSLTYGKAAATTTRAVTDNTFDYNLIVTFENLENVKVYETHPEHIRAAGEFSKYWDKVQVRDTIVTL